MSTFYLVPVLIWDQKQPQSFDTHKQWLTAIPCKIQKIDNAFVISFPKALTGGGKSVYSCKGGWCSLT